MLRTWIVIGLSLTTLGGCAGRSSSPHLTTPERLSRGLVLILPGIEGESSFNRDIRDGLANGGVDCGIEICHWGTPELPLAGPLINQMNFLGNRNEGKRIARRIAEYQDRYPHAPVYLVGHSGGGGIAVFAAESLPPGHKVDGLILLAPSISSGYNLDKALANTRYGIVNFYSPADVGFLVLGTTLAGNVDGARGPAAGAFGFDRPLLVALPESYQRLVQVNATDAGVIADAHTAATGQKFVSTRVAPYISDWPGQSPPPRSKLHATTQLSAK